MLYRILIPQALVFVIVVGSFSENQEALETGCRHVPVNVTFIPELTANGLSGANTENNVSLNVIGGSSGSLRGVEFGGVFNMEKGNVRGTQFAGCVNIVGSHCSGAQFAGGVNSVKENFAGAQFSGILNTVGDNAKGAQFSGIANYTPEPSGVAQFSGLVNVAGSGGAVQFAGISNLANRIDGAQISLVNIAREVNGVQIGLINIAENINGAPLGIFSYVKSVGLHYQFFVDETGFGNTALRCRGKNVYTLLSAGLESEPDIGGAWSLGYGIGVRHDLDNRFLVNADVITQFLQHRDNWENDLNLITRYRVGGGFRVNDHFAIIGGLTGNKMKSRVEDGSAIVPEWLSDAEKKDDTWHRFWPGVYFGVEL